MKIELKAIDPKFIKMSDMNKLKEALYEVVNKYDFIEEGHVIGFHIVGDKEYESTKR